MERFCAGAPLTSPLPKPALRPYKSPSPVKPGCKGRDRMDFQYLFTSFDGRINRAKYWAGVVILAIISIVLGFIIGAHIRTFDPWRHPGDARDARPVLCGLCRGSEALPGPRQAWPEPALYGLVPVLMAELPAASGLPTRRTTPNALAGSASRGHMGVGLLVPDELGVLGTPGPTGSAAVFGRRAMIARPSSRSIARSTQLRVHRHRRCIQAAPWPDLRLASSPIIVLTP